MLRFHVAFSGNKGVRQFFIAVFVIDTVKNNVNHHLGLGLNLVLFLFQCNKYHERIMNIKSGKAFK